MMIESIVYFDSNDALETLEIRAEVVPRGSALLDFSSNKSVRVFCLHPLRRPASREGLALWHERWEDLALWFRSREDLALLFAHRSDVTFDTHAGKHKCELFELAII
jgi:hypothetical protein